MHRLSLNCDRLRPLRSSRQGAALYSLTLSTALLVSILGMSALMVSRIDRRHHSESNDVFLAQHSARAAIEFGFAQIDNNPNWRSDLANGVESAQVPFNTEGSFTWYIEDLDGSLSYPNDSMFLVGVGRQNNAAQAYRVQLSATLSTSSETTLSSETDFGDTLTEDVEPDRWFALHVEPNLPADTVHYWITSVEIYGKKRQGGQELDVVFYEGTASGFPSSTIIETITTNSNQLSNKADWNQFDLTSKYLIDPTTPVSIALQTTSVQSPFTLTYTDNNSGSDDQAMARGLPNWTSIDSKESYLFRLYGYYETVTNEIHAIEGTWSSYDVP